MVCPFSGVCACFSFVSCSFLVRIGFCLYLCTCVCVCISYLQFESRACFTIPSSLLFQLLQKVGRLEVLGHRIVHARNYLVDRFLPRLFRVLAALNRPEELAQRLLDHEPEVLRNLFAHNNIWRTFSISKRVTWGVVLQKIHFGDAK